MHMTDTIAAVSTPRGTGGIAVLRVSGGDAVKICSRVFRPASRRPLDEIPHASAVYGAILRAPDGDTLDHGIATVFRAPRSYTGEDTVEISCHGGALLTEYVLAAILSAGARQAEAGEFTRRAFASGKLTLSEAEAVGNLIHAKTGAQIDAAAPTLSPAIAEIADLLTSLIARASVVVDYPDEDLADISPDELRRCASDAALRLQKLQATYRTGRAVVEGVVTVICGRPNAGKSTLYNLFAGEDAAIVTDIAGTTRDTLTRDVAAGRVLLRLSDTAGIRDARDSIESIGVERARARIADAELLIAVHDAHLPPDDVDREILFSSARVKIAVINKLDDPDSAGGEVAAEYRALAESAGAIPVDASLISGRGFDQIVAAIECSLTDGSLVLGHDAIVTNARQAAQIGEALDGVDSAVDALDAGAPVDIAVCELQRALDALLRLDGRQAADEVLDEIFSKFCVGK